MFLRSLALIATLASLVHPALAEPATPEAVSQALRLTEVMAVMRDEGVNYGKDLADELFPDADLARWQKTVGDIYDAADVRKRFDTVFAERLQTRPADLPVILDFFTTDLGKKVVGLEIDARRTMLDQAAEDAARLSWSTLEDDDPSKASQVRRFEQANQLIDENVAGTMNANVAFYRGLNEGGAFEGDKMDEQDILFEVRGQEHQIRQETEDWLMPYLALAYHPLSEKEFGDYIDFSETSAGATLNAALFAAYDAAYTEISHQLGLAAARVLAGQDI